MIIESNTFVLMSICKCWASYAHSFLQIHLFSDLYNDSCVENARMKITTYSPQSFGTSRDNEANRLVKFKAGGMG